MPSIAISVIDVSQPMNVSTAKGGYNFIEVAYKKDGKVEGKKIVDFADKTVFAAVQALKAGQDYEVSLEKDNNGYWKWTGITPVAPGEAGTKEPTGDVRQGGVVASPRAAGRVTGSNYESAEERARRQVLIVRQSSLTAALGLLTHNAGKGHVDPNAVAEMAEYFVAFVFEKPTPQTGVVALQEMDDDVPV